LRRRQQANIHSGDVINTITTTPIIQKHTIITISPAVVDFSSDEGGSDTFTAACVDTTITVDVVSVACVVDTMGCVDTTPTVVAVSAVVTVDAIGCVDTAVLSLARSVELGCRVDTVLEVDTSILVDGSSAVGVDRMLHAVDPMACVNVPGAHTWHADMPYSPAYWPIGHGYDIVE
jgi:hypothetical protein